MACWLGVGSPPGHGGGFTLGEVSVHLVHFPHVCCVTVGHPRVRGAGQGFGGGGGGNHQGRVSPPPGGTVTPQPPGISDTGWAGSTGRLPGFANGDSLLLAATNTGLPHVILRMAGPRLPKETKMLQVISTSFNNVSPRGSLVKLICNSSKTGSHFSPPASERRPQAGEAKTSKSRLDVPHVPAGDSECCRAPASCVACTRRSWEVPGVRIPR